MLRDVYALEEQTVIPLGIEMNEAYEQDATLQAVLQQLSEGEDALFSLVRAAFQAGWLAAGGEESTAVRMFEVLRAEDFRKKS